MKQQISYLYPGVSALAVAALLSSGHALAQPNQNQLPTGGEDALGNVDDFTYDADDNSLLIEIDGNTAIRWVNQGGDILAPDDFEGVTGRGFNIGEGATVDFEGAGAVLNVDRTGNPSQIFGALEAQGALFVANENGVIVGSSGEITAGGDIAILGFRQDAGNFGGDVEVNESTVTAGGDIVVEKGANLDTSDNLLIAGAGAVNVDSVAVDGALVGAGHRVDDSGTLGAARDDLDGSITISGGAASVDELASSGDITTAVNAGLEVDSDIRWGGTLSNSGTIDLASLVTEGEDSGDLTNTGVVEAEVLSVGGSIMNQGKMDMDGAGSAVVAVGSVSNAGQIIGVSNVVAGHTTDGGTKFALAVDEDGDPVISGLSNAGSIRNAVGPLGLGASGDLSNTGLIRSEQGTVGLSAGIDLTDFPTRNLIDGSEATITSTGVIDVGVDGTDARNLPVIAPGNVAISTLRAGGQAGSADNRLGILEVTSAEGNITLNNAAWVEELDASAEEGSIFVNAPVNAEGGTGEIGMDAGNQIFLRSSLVAESDVALDTLSEGSGPFDLGIVQFNEGDVIESDAGDVTLNAGDPMEGGSSILLYGDVMAEAGDVTMTGSNVYAGTENAITSNTVEFNYSGVITGGIAKGSGTQVGDAFDRGVNIVSPDGMDVDVNLNPTDLVASRHNTNLLVTGLDEGSSADVAVDLGTVEPINAEDSVVIDEDALRSNLFVRSDADLNLDSDTGADFYWPGRIYASTIEPGTLGTVGSGELSFGNDAGGEVSNVLPRVTSEGAAGMFLISNDIEGIDSLVVNANSIVNLANEDLAGAFRAENTANDDFAFTAGEPVGTTLTFDEELPNTSIQSFTAPER